MRKLICWAILATSIFFYLEAWALTASYEQTLSGTNIPAPHKSSVKIKDNKMRIDAESPQGKTVSIMDGKTVYSYFPSMNKAFKFVVEGAPDMNTLTNYAVYLKTLGAKVVGSEQLGEYDCDIYEFKDPKTQADSKVWLWKAKEFPVKVETKVSGGIVTTTIENLQLGGEINDSEFTIPAGTEIVEAAPQAGEK